MKKIYVLDTNVLLENPDCITESFDENDLVIPLTVIEELDGLKKAQGEKGYSARQALRNIESLRKSNGNIKDWVVRNEDGGRLKIVYLDDADRQKFNTIGVKGTNDMSIVFTALKVKEKEGDSVILVSNDTSVRVISSFLDMKTDYYKDSHVSQEAIDYYGYRTVVLPSSFFGEITLDNRWVNRRLPMRMELDELVQAVEEEMAPPSANEFFLLEPEDVDDEYLSRKEKKKLKVVYRFQDGALVKKNLNFRNVYGGVTGKNLEQSVALEILLDDDVKVVALSGLAGSGKTLISITACLTKLLKEKDLGYEKLIILKPTIAVSDEIGFLPGSMEEKVGQYLGSYFDNFKVLKKMETVSTKQTTDDFEKLKEKGLVEIESISFLRGRSLSDCLIIVDETQNVTQGVMKTILTRVGENCKIILLGDVQQVDRPYLSKHNNGLCYAIERLRGQSFFGHVKFVQGVRSEVSRICAELL